MKTTFMLPAAAALALMPLLSQAGPLYQVNRTVGAGSVIGSIETDGTLGTLAAANLLAWNLTIDDGTNGPFTLNTGNSAYALAGSVLSATTSQLIFDFAVPSSYLFFQNPTLGSGINGWCLSTSSPSCLGGARSQEAIIRTNTAAQRQVIFPQGVQVIGTLNSVPEPGTLALLGLGLLGLAAAQRRFV